MGIEIEAKMRVSDVAALEARLESAGAKRGRTVVELDRFFDTPQGSLKASDRGLRLRIERELNGPYQSVTITHKGPRDPGRLKRRPETELAVRNGDDQAAAELLTAMGYECGLSFEKRRTQWHLDDCRVDVDRLPYLGDFVEIEGPTDDAVLAVRHKLGLDQTPLVRDSYIAMLSTYLAENHLRADPIRLDPDTLTNP